MSPTTHRLLADAIVVLHAGFIAFVVGGQLLILAGWPLGWRWVRNLYFRAAHLLAIGFVVVQAWLGAWCPLTSLEEHFRRQAGESRYGDDAIGFIGYWAHELIFFDAPRWVFTLTYTLFAALVVLTFIFVRPRRPCPPCPSTP